MIAQRPQDRVRSLVIGYGAQTIIILVFSAYWLLYVLAPNVYLSFLRGLEPAIWPYPFLDLESVLTAIDCARQGVDVTLPNACMSGGLFQYSPLLLKTAALPLHASQRVPLGLSLDGLFLLSFFALPHPQRWSEFWALLLAGVSTSTLFAVERANLDVLLYLLSFGAALLLLRGGRVRIAGYGVILLAAGIKFYPASLMALALRESAGKFFTLAAISLLATLLLVVGYHDELERVVTQLPHGMAFANTFSAGRLPEGVAWFVGRGDPNAGAGPALRIMLLALLIGYAVFRVWNCVPFLMPGMRRLAEKERILLVAGALLTLFCFFLAQNIYYREIFLIPTLPGWFALQRDATDPALKTCARLTAGAVVAVLWIGFFRYGIRDPLRNALGIDVAMDFWFGVWLLYEAIWWWLVSTLIAVVLCFIGDSKAFVWLSTALRRQAGRPRIR